MQIYDCHVHTAYSHDGKATAEEQCGRGAELSLCGITLTDHNYPPRTPYENREHIKASVEHARRLSELYEGRLTVLSGAEVADIFLGGGDDTPVYEAKPDFLLGSVHSAAIFRKYFPDEPIKTLLGNGKHVTLDFAKRFTERYFLEMLKNAEKADVDAVAHLTYPLRYINGDGKLGLCVSEFSGITDEIFKALIKRDLALEVNTSGYMTEWGECMPPKELLCRYYELGGRKITLGSDSHTPETLARGIPEAILMLKETGFTHACYYVKRKAQEYVL